MHYTQHELDDIKLARMARIQREEAARYAAQLRFERQNKLRKINTIDVLATVAFACIALYGVLGGAA